MYSLRIPDYGSNFNDSEFSCDMQIAQREYALITESTLCEDSMQYVLPKNTTFFSTNACVDCISLKKERKKVIGEIGCDAKAAKMQCTKAFKNSLHKIRIQHLSICLQNICIWQALYGCQIKHYCEPSKKWAKIRKKYNLGGNFQKPLILAF